METNLLEADEFTPLAYFQRPLHMAMLSLLALVAISAIWSWKAELATSIKIPGVLSSPRSSFSVQTPQGGSVETVEVSLLETVQKGDLLLTLDRRSEILQLEMLHEQRRYLEAEIAQIELLLEPHKDARTPPELTEIEKVVGDEYRLRKVALDTRLLGLKKQAALLDLESSGISSEISTVQEIQRLLTSRHKHLILLIKKGAATQLEADSVQERLLSIATDLAAKDAAMLAARGAAQLARHEAATLVDNQNSELATKLRNIKRQLSEITSQIAHLDIVIASGFIRAPIDGVITELDFATPGTVSLAGQTLAVVTYPLLVPTIELRIPPNYVDQVRPGQKGHVIVSGLPQREMPKLNITVIAVSAETVPSTKTNSETYFAHAEFAPGALSTAKTAMGEKFQLVLDMPVTVILAGHPTTMARFLFGPIIAMRGTVFED